MPVVPSVLKTALFASLNGPLMLFSLLSILLPFSMISGCLLLFTWLTTLLPRPLTTSLQSAPVFTPAVLRFIPCIPSVLVSTCFSDLLLLNTVTPDP